MQIIQAYKGKFELTQSQKDALYQKACMLKKQGFKYMFVDVYVPMFASELVLEYVATDLENTERAFVGKKGALSNGLGKNNKKGYKYSQGNSLEYTIPNIDKFEHVVTI